LPSAVQVTTIPTYGHPRAPEGGDVQMTWEVPTFVEIKMDAEINSYQEDGPEDF